MKKKNNSLVAVCARSVSKNNSALELLKKNFHNIRLNKSNKILQGPQLFNFLKDAKAAIIGLENIDGKLLSKCKKLEVIGKYGVGTNNIDFRELKKSKVKILLQPGINKRAVSELTLSFMIQGLRDLNEQIQDVKNRKWPFKFGRLLSHKTVGIIGFGNTGSDVYDLLKPFGCKIIASDISKNKFFLKRKIKNSSLKKLLNYSDIITIHIPLDKKNFNFFSKKEFNTVKKNLILINTSRGGIVDEKSLYNFLVKNKRSRALFDVMINEPTKHYRLLKLNNFVLTPHLAGSTVEIANTASINCVKKVINYFKT